MRNESLIETERLVMRHWRPDDAEALYRYASDARVSELAMWPRHTSLDMSRKVIRDYFMPCPDVFAVVCRETGEAVGCIGLVPPGDEHIAVRPGEREVGYWIGYPLWGHGLMTEALMAFVTYCRDRLRLGALHLTTDRRNTASQRVALKCGFAPMGDYTYDDIQGKAFRLGL